MEFEEVGRDCRRVFRVSKGWPVRVEARPYARPERKVIVLSILGSDFWGGGGKLTGSG